MTLLCILIGSVLIFSLYTYFKCVKTAVSWIYAAVAVSSVGSRATYTNVPVIREPDSDEDLLSRINTIPGFSSSHRYSSLLLLNLCTNGDDIISICKSASLLLTELNVFSD